ncbi:MAG: hypothetical protein PHX21_12010 [bacterium]|nr:hypothetical protein [bacterium]
MEEEIKREEGKKKVRKKKKIKFDAKNVKVEDIGNIVSVKKIGIKRISLFVISLFVIGILYLIEYFSTVGLTFQLDRENRSLKKIGEELDNLRAKEVNLARYDRIVNTGSIESDSSSAVAYVPKPDSSAVKETKNKVQKIKTDNKNLTVETQSSQRKEKKKTTSSKNKK